MEHHSELDFLDTLNIADSAPQAPLKVLLLDDSSKAKETQRQLEELLRRRIEEGHGETLFELGLEDNGESMGLSPTEWGTAWTRLQAAATALTADCHILISRNTGLADDVDAAGADDHGHRSSVAKIMIRRRPPTVAEVIELRIAVVGNGRSIAIHRSETRAAHDPLSRRSRRRKEYHARRLGQGEPRRWTWKGTSEPVPPQTRDREWSNEFGGNGDHGLRRSW